MQVNLHDAKTNLSRYVEQGLDGEEVVIARAGKALVRLVPVDEAPRRRELGFLQGSAVLDCNLKADLLHWLAIAPERLPATLSGDLRDRRFPMLYSVVSLWEVAIKTSLGKTGFVVDAAQLRDGLKQQGHQVIWMGDGGSGG